MAQGSFTAPLGVPQEDGAPFSPNGTSLGMGLLVSAAAVVATSVAPPIRLCSRGGGAKALPASLQLPLAAPGGVFLSPAAPTSSLAPAGGSSESESSCRSQGLLSSPLSPWLRKVISSRSEVRVSCLPALPAAEEQEGGWEGLEGEGRACSTLTEESGGGGGEGAG